MRMSEIIPPGATAGVVGTADGGAATGGRGAATGRGATGVGATGRGAGGVGTRGAGAEGGTGGGGATSCCAIAGTSHATAKTAAATGVGQRFLTRLCRTTPHPKTCSCLVIDPSFRSRDP